MAFAKNILKLFLSTSMAVIAISSTIVIADPLNETAIAKGTLSGIVSKNYPNTTLSKAQIMIAILAANPHAFRGGNINFMSRNQELSLPSEAMIASIPANNAAALLVQHNRFYQRGKTGNLTPPTFIRTGEDPAALEKLKTEYRAQTEHVEELAAESTKLQNLVQHLESEKSQRDEDLRLLEEKIQLLKTSDGKRLPEEESANEQRLKEKNAALQQQLVESKSELIENNRTTISLERRVIELQEQEQQQIATQKNNPVVTSSQVNDNKQTQASDNTTATDVVDIPTTDLNGNIISPKENLLSGFHLSKLLWLLPILAVLAGIGLLLKRFFGTKKYSELNLDEIDDFDFRTPKMTDKERGGAYGESSEPATEAPLEVSIKLDVARAYMEAEDNQSAYEMLNEVLQEGNKDQQAEAKLLLKRL